MSRADRGAALVFMVYSELTAIFFTSDLGCSVFGKVRCRTPFLKVALTCLGRFRRARGGNVRRGRSFVR